MSITSRGTIIDRVDGTPVAGALVYADRASGRHGVQVGDDGSYVLSLLDPGELLTVQMLDYEPLYFSAPTVEDAPAQVIRLSRTEDALPDLNVYPDPPAQSNMGWMVGLGLLAAALVAASSQPTRKRLRGDL